MKFFENKGFDVIKAILKRENPEKVCQILNICKKRDEVIQQQQIIGKIYG